MAYFTEKREFNKDKDKDYKSKDPKKRLAMRQRNTARYQLPKDALIDYKNVVLLQKYLNDRGKIVPRRISGIGAKEQRDLCSAIKKARFLALLTSGSTHYR